MSRLHPTPARAHAYSRRRFLQQAFAGVGACATASCAQLSRRSHERPHHVDAHVHVWTPDVARYPLAPGFAAESMRPRSFTPEELRSHTHPVGVKRVVLIQMSFYGFDNSYMLDSIRAQPGVFRGVAVIDENAAPARTMAQYLAAGVSGFRIRPGSESLDGWLRTAGMEAMWRTAAESGQQMCALINPEHLPALDRMCERFPRTPVVIDHFGRVGIDGEITEPQLRDLCRLARHRNVTMKISAYYALGRKRAPYLDLLPMIRRVLTAYGPERLMWASDGPFQVVNGHNYRDSIELVRTHLDELSDGDRDWLLRRTAESTFFQHG